MNSSQFPGGATRPASRESDASSPGAPSQATACADHEIDVQIDARLDAVPTASAGAGDEVEASRSADARAMARRMQAWARLALAHAEGPCSISVRVVDEPTMHALNARYRQRDRATNVLSFPAEVPVALAQRPLGDVVVCAPVVVREAVEAGVPVTAHYAHMVIHGTLHLLGYDHQEDAEAAIMEDLEGRLLAAAGFPDPYRHSSSTAEEVDSPHGLRAPSE